VVLRKNVNGNNLIFKLKLGMEKFGWRACSFIIRKKESLIKIRDIEKCC
jgi:hypothetical protein